MHEKPLVFPLECKNANSQYLNSNIGAIRRAVRRTVNLAVTCKKVPKFRTNFKKPTATYNDN